MYYRGEGVTKDVEESIKWLTKAADQGDLISQTSLGAIYYRGEGVPKDVSEALKWLILGGSSQAEARSARQALEREMTDNQKLLAAQRAQKFMQLKHPHP